ncbi:unnamed protein product [Rhizoctonia solani]|uniref:Uncharacterized protein n=1 Tax=Rhizoctonia solani TaxID=456999 RepID=A0A8H3BL38_9AGAM|nr:unnamed protein product [Rhizoctonia solani]
MAPGILNKLRRRQSTSPHRPHSYVHHVSTTPEWPTSPAQVTPDVYLTSPEEEDGLLTSVCVHRAIENEPKRLRKEGKHDSNPPPVAAASALAAALASADDPASPVSDSPPAFRRSSLQTSDIVLPKKPSEIVRETPKWNPLGKDKLDEVSEVNAQGDGKHVLTRISSGRDANEGMGVSKPKVTLRHRASKVLKSFTHRDNEKRVSHQESKPKAPRQHKRRNTLSDSSQSALNVLAQASTAHAIPQETGTDDVPGSPPPRSSGEGNRRRSSTLGHVEFTSRPSSPQRPPLPGGDEGIVHEAARKVADSPPSPVITLEPAAEIDSPVGPTAELSTGEKPKKLQRRRSKNAFSHLFTLKSEKIFRSPPPAKTADEPIPPVPSIPEELAKVVADLDTPEVSQTSAFTSTPTTTPKSTKSKRFRRHRRATIGSVSQLPSDITGTPSSVSTTPRSETPKNPTTRVRTFTIVDLRKGFQVRGLGRGKGKLFSAKSNPEIRSSPSVQELSSASESRENLESTQRHRPPPLQPTESQSGLGFPIAVNGETDGSPGTADFVASLETAEVLPSPIESTGPVTPVFGVLETPAPAPVVEPQAKTSSSTEGEPDLSYSATTDEGEQTLQRPSSASEATLLSDDPLFTALSAPSTLGDLQLQLREPATKTSTLDAHLRLGSLRFEDFSFDTNIF